jgi:predicted DNA-binding transcriptional regulator YafY
MTVGELARELEVSSRTVLRDIDALSGAGIPVYAIRGKSGGIELLRDAAVDVPFFRVTARRLDSSGRVLRATVRLSPQGRRLAALLGRPTGVRVRKRAAPPERLGDWVEASVRIDSLEAALPELLARGGEVEVVRPIELRALLREEAARIVERHSS